MEKLGRVWNKLNYRHISQSYGEIKDDENDSESIPPDTKKVFELFAVNKNASRHRASLMNLPSNSVKFEKKTNRNVRPAADKKDLLKPEVINRRARSNSPNRKDPFNNDLLSSSSANFSDADDSLCGTKQTTIRFSDLPKDLGTELKQIEADEFDFQNDQNYGNRSKSSSSRASSSFSMACSSNRQIQRTRRCSEFVRRGSMLLEPIKHVDLNQIYSVYQQLGTGRFGYIKLAEHKESGQKIAIKFFPRPDNKQTDFIREYNYSYFLSPHPNIVNTFEGIYQSSDESAFFFVQELCPHASLREIVENSQTGIGEEATKTIMSKVIAALEFMHDENLVHRNLKAETILIFDKGNTRVKLCDFGLTRKVNSTVKYLEYVNNYHPPELCETVVNEVFTVNQSIDIWAIGILFYFCLKARFPWKKATIMCKQYWEWEQWLKRKIPQLSKRWEPFNDKTIKLFKKTLNPRYKDRWSVKNIQKFITKERLLKVQKNVGDDYEYYPDNEIESGETSAEKSQKKSTIQQWIDNTLTTMAEISEQVVSARGY